jgi:hypothetical protein
VALVATNGEKRNVARPNAQTTASEREQDREKEALGRHRICQPEREGKMTRFNEVLEEASKRVELKELVWKIYKNPKKVLVAIDALKKVLDS